MSEPFARVVAHSINEYGIPIITLHLRYWRAIHAEFMTHRFFSRNARSSRAVPINKMLQEIQDDPFIPRHWGKNQKGMQASEECNELVDFYSDEFIETGIGEYEDGWIKISREDAWLKARNNALNSAKSFGDAGYHKQIVNRLVEPFMWIDTLVTATNWENFYSLRIHEDAEPHIRDLAVLIKKAVEESTPVMLEPGQWHLPYVNSMEYVNLGRELGRNDLRGLSADDDKIVDILRKVSAARCARISYAPFDGNSSIEAEISRYEKLVLSWPVHASPVEHQATPDTGDWIYDASNGGERVRKWSWDHPEDHRNFYGWRQFRSQIEKETTHDRFINQFQTVSVKDLKK